MKTLGLIGGTTWVSTIDYYKYINQLSNERLGGSNSARLLLFSVNFQEIKDLGDADNWEQIGNILSDAAKRLENAGADALMLCANTMHIAAETVQQSISIPLLHIVDATAKEIEKQKMGKVGLLGTKFTMEKEFFKQGLLNYNIETIIPDSDDREFIHSSIYSELGKNIFKDETRQKYLEITKNLQMKGAEGVIFGCTEIPMLIKPEDCDVASFDTTLIHAKYAVDFALASAD